MPSHSYHTLIPQAQEYFNIIKDKLHKYKLSNYGNPKFVREMHEAKEKLCRLLDEGLPLYMEPAAQQQQLLLLPAPIQNPVPSFFDNINSTLNAPSNEENILFLTPSQQIQSRSRSRSNRPKTPRSPTRKRKRSKSPNRK